MCVPHSVVIKRDISINLIETSDVLMQTVFRGRSQPWLLSNGLGDASFATRNDGTGYSNEIAGACDQPHARVDRWVTTELTDSLFANRKMLGKEMGERAS